MFKQFKEIADQCLKGTISGIFITRNRIEIPSSELSFETDNWFMDRNNKLQHYPYLLKHGKSIFTFTKNGENDSERITPMDIMEFIPDDKYANTKKDYMLVINATEALYPPKIDFSLTNEEYLFLCKIFDKINKETDNINIELNIKEEQ